MAAGGDSGGGYPYSLHVEFDKAAVRDLFFELFGTCPSGEKADPYRGYRHHDVVGNVGEYVKISDR
jgi:hypothetical protein